MSQIDLQQLSAAQLSVYFDHAKHPDSSRYNLDLVCQIVGDLNFDKLNHCFRNVLARQPYSQDWFQDGIVLTDLTQHSLSQAQALALQNIAEIKIIPIALDTAEQQQVSYLYQIAPARYLWFVMVHHLISDGFGIRNLMLNTAALYRTDKLECLASFERAMLAKPKISNLQAKSAHFWQTKLAPFKSEKILPALENTYGEQTNFRGHYFSDSLILPTGETRSNDRTVDKVVRAALTLWCYLQGEQAGEQKVQLGNAFHGRSKAELHQSLGMHSLVLPLLLTISDDHTLGQILDELAKQTRLAYKHTPFELGQHAQAAQLSNEQINRINQAVFNVIDISDNLDFGRASGELVFLPRAEYGAPLQLRLYHTPTGYQLVLCCQQRFFSQTQAEQVFTQIRDLCQWVASSSLDSQISELSHYRSQARALRNYQTKLNDAPQVNRFPTDRLDPNGTAQPIITSETKAIAKAKIQALCQIWQTERFNLMLSVWQLMLSYYVGQRHVMVASYRDELPQWQAVLSEVELDGDLNQLLQANSATLTLLAEHDWQSIYDISSLQTAIAETNDTLNHSFDLLLNISQVSDNIVLTVEFNSALYSTEFVSNLLEHFQQVLSLIEQHHSRGCRDILALPEPQLKAVMAFSQTRQAYSNKGNVLDLIEQITAQYGESIAIDTGKQQLTFHQLEQLSNQFAHLLVEQGVAANSLVALAVSPSPTMIVGILAILKVGAAYLPIDANLPARRISYILADAKPQLLLIEQGLEHLFDDELLSICPSINLAFNDELQAKPSYFTCAEIHEQQLAYVIYTSGSTGKPKGTLLPHQGLFYFIQALIEQLQLKPGKRALQFASFNFDASVWEIFAALCSGATLCLVDKTQLAAGDVLQNTLIELNVDTAILPPVLLPYLEPSRLTQLKTLAVGGEACSAELVQVWSQGRRFINAYGPTEATVCSTMFHCQAERQGQPPIGKPLINVKVYVLDSELNPVPIGVAGELYIGGTNLARGYLNKPALTAERFLPDPFSEQVGARMYQSGDLVRWLADGNLEYLGRIDEQVKIRGYRVELGEIESALKKLPDIDNALVLLDNSETQPRLVAYCIGQVPQDNQRIRQALAQNLPDYMLPSAYVWLSAFPLTPSGKIDKNALPSAEQIQQNYVAPRNELEAKLSVVWQEMLGIDAIGVLDDFFELGGNSITATRIIASLQKQWQISMPLTVFFSQTTISSQAEHISNSQVSNDSVINQSLSSLPITPVDTSSLLPVSYVQQRLWLLAQIESNPALYNISCDIRLLGNLNLAALELAIQHLVSCHQAFRTVFVAQEGKPYQQILDSLIIKIPVVDLTELAENEREAECKQLAMQLAIQPFDLQTGPLFAVKLIQLEAEQAYLSFTMHHIIADGWSLGLMKTELSNLYQGYCNAVSLPLQMPSIQYADYANWQQSDAVQHVYQQQLVYWQQQLADVPERINLPTDFPRPAQNENQGQRIAYSLDASLINTCRQLANEQQVTLFMVLTAAFNVLLARYSGQTDICVGTPIANRNRVEFESMFGAFINTLVLRNQYDSQLSFSQLLAQVKQTTLAAYQHQDVPFELLVDALNVARDANSTPLFQVMLVLQNAPKAQWQLPGITVEPQLLDRGVAKFDLTLGLLEQDGGLLALFEYNTALFAPSTIHAMTKEFHHLLATLVKHNQTSMANLPLLSAEQYQRWLVDWNQNSISYDFNDCFHRRFEQQVEQTPNAIAITYQGQSLSYLALNQQANQFARYLSEQNVANDDVIALCFERSLDMLVAILAVLKAGAGYLPLDPKYPKDRLNYILADAKPRFLISQQACMGVCQSLQGNGLLINMDDAAWQERASQNLNLSVHPDNLAYVIYTSGSTGKPKGVQISHANMVNLALSHIHGIHRATKKGPLKASLNAPYIFDAFVSELSLLLDGHSLYLIPDDIRLSPDEMQAFFSEHQLDALDSSPAQLKYLVENNRLDSLPKIVVFGGEAIDGALWQRLQNSSSSRFFNAYGPTECTVDVALACVNDSGDYPVIGRTQANSQLYVLDADANPLPQGAVGELYVGGVSLARGYLNKPDMTAERFVPDPFSNKAGQRLYKTGDQVRINQAGQLEFIGRLDDQVKIRGFRIELSEIESVLNQHDHVRDGLVIPIKQPTGDALAAYVVMQPQHQPFDYQAELACSITQVINKPAWLKQFVAVQQASQSVYLAQIADSIELTSRDNEQYQLTSLAMMPYMRAAFDWLHTDIWPDYFNGSPVLKSHWQRLYQYFPDAQMLLMQANDVIGIGNSVLLNWNGEADNLPEGWDGAVCQAVTEYQQGIQPNTLVVLAGVIDANYKHKKLASLIVDGFKQLAQSLGLSHLIVALRPIAKVSQQTMAITDYAELQNEQGQLADAWLRLHINMGGQVLAAQPQSQLVEGSLADWQEWTGTSFEQSGLVQLADTLAPVAVDIEADIARYYDPCIWVEHPLSAQTTIQIPSSAKIYQTLLQDNIIQAPARLVVVNQLPEIGDNAATDDSWQKLLSQLSRFAEKKSTTSLLRDYLSARLPHYMIPAHFVVLDKMPLTVTGKVDRKALPAPEQSEQETAHYVAPQNPTQYSLCAVWQEIFPHCQVGIKDNFFELGGDSILSIRAVARARQQGIIFTAKQLFANQTIAELAQVVQSVTKKPQSQAAIVGELALLPIQHEFFNEAASDHFNQSFLINAPQSIDETALSALTKAIYQKHDVLRVQFNLKNGIWRAKHQPLNEDMVKRAVVVINGREWSAEQTKQHIEECDSRYQQSLSIQKADLARFVLFQLGDGSNKLLIILHHLVVDGVSWRILFKDLEQGFNTWQTEQQVKLANKTSSYQQWAEFLAKYANSEQLQGERGYWEQTLSQPVDLLPNAGQIVADDSMAQTAKLAIALSNSDTQLLLTQCHHAYATQINDLLVSAVMLGLHQWSGASHLRLLLEGHGREELTDEVDLSETLGWFTTAFPLWLSLTDANDLRTVIEQIKQRLRAIPNKGIGYGVLRYLHEQGLPEPEVQQTIVFNYLGQFVQAQNEQAYWQIDRDFSPNTISSQHPRNAVLGFNGAVKNGQLLISLDYNALRYSTEQMTELATAVEQALLAIIHHCQNQVALFNSSKAYRYRELISGDGPLLPNAYDFLKRFDRNHWNASDLYQTPADINLDQLKLAVAYTLEQHDGLRSILVNQQGHWRQRFLLPYQMAGWWQIEDLADLPETSQVHEIEQRSAQWQKTLDIEQVMFRAVYFDLGEGKAGRLLLVIHHVLLDRFGGEILIDDLQLAYSAISKGKEPVFADKSTSVKRLAEIWQQRASHPDVVADLNYWRQLNWSAFKPLPAEVNVSDLVSTQAAAVMGRVCAKLSKQQTKDVISAIQASAFDLADVVNCAMVRAYGSWSGSSAVFIINGHNGRSLDFAETVDLSRTVGWCMNYTRTPVDLNGCDSLLHSISRTHQQLNQFKDREANYGLLRYLHPDPAIRDWFEQIPDGQFMFAVVPLHVTAESTTTSGWLTPAKESQGAVEGPLEAGFKPFGLAVVIDRELQIIWNFCRSQFSEATWLAFADQTLKQTQLLAKQLSAANSNAATADKIVDLVEG